SNMIGLETMHIEMGSSVEVAARDTLVLGSDGLFDNLRLDEIVQLVRQGPTDRAAAALVDACRARMELDDPEHPSKPDDLTAVVFRFLNSNGASSPNGRVRRRTHAAAPRPKT